MENQEFQGHLVFLEIQDDLETLVKKVLLDHLAHKESQGELDHLVYLGFLENEDFLDFQECLV